MFCNKHISWAIESRNWCSIPASCSLGPFKFLFWLFEVACLVGHIAMTERIIQASSYDTRKSIFCIFSASVVILVFSCYFLLMSSSSSLLPESVLMLMLVNSTLVSKSIGKESAAKLPQNASPDRPSVLETASGNCSSLNNMVSISVKERREACDRNRALLKIFMYNLPPEFHFGLMGWKDKDGRTWPDVSRTDRIPDYPGGLNLQHSTEYWLTLDLLSSNIPGVARPCTAVRVENSSEADVLFVPFFSSLSYNRFSKLHGKEKVSKNKMLQDKLVKFLLNKEEWKRCGGRDHLIVAHHPNSMLDARRKLGSAMFVLADFGRYPTDIANLKKDVIAPYRHVVHTVGNDSATFEERQILLYFQGAIYRKDGGIIRQELYYLLKDEKDVHFAFGSAQGNGINKASQGMRSSKFCLNVAGDTPSSNRLFDAIASHCIPVIISDEIELPFEDVLDYSKFCIFVRASDAVKKGFLLNLLKGIKHDEWTKMWQVLKEVIHHFEYQYPSQRGDSVQMIWEAVARKISTIQLKFHRGNRYHQFWLAQKHN